MITFMHDDEKALTTKVMLLYQAVCICQKNNWPLSSLCEITGLHVKPKRTCASLYEMSTEGGTWQSYRKEVIWKSQIESCVN